MRTREIAHTSTGAYESRAWIERLRGRLIWFVLIGLFFVSLVVADSPRLFPLPSQSVTLALTVFALAFVVGLMYAWQPCVAAWTLAVGCVAVPLLAVTWGGLLEAVWLFTLSVGLSILLVGTVPGAVVAGCCTLFLLFASPTVLPVPATGRAVAIAGIWGIVGMVGLALHSLLQALQWAWSHYEREHITLRIIDRGREVR